MLGKYGCAEVDRFHSCRINTARIQCTNTGTPVIIPYVLTVHSKTVNVLPSRGTALRMLT